MASIQDTATNIIKSDRIGRTRYSQAYKDEVIAANHQSNMSAAAFAEHCGVIHSTFASWIFKARQSGNAHSDPDEHGQQFILAEIGGRRTESPLKIELPGGAVAHVSSSDQLRLLTEKFCYHQPFYRLEWRLRATHGIELRRDLMCSWHNHIAEMVLPLHRRLKEQMRSGDYLEADETPVRCLAHVRRKFVEVKEDQALVEQVRTHGADPYPP